MTRRKSAPERRRGRHKKALSAEVVAWEQRVRCPGRPSWMDDETYAKLRRLRAEIDPLQ